MPTTNNSLTGSRAKKSSGNEAGVYRRGAAWQRIEHQIQAVVLARGLEASDG